MIKPTDHGVPTPWHQDAAYYDENFEYWGLTFWTALDRTTLDNGCMHYIAGSHCQEVAAHHTIITDTEAPELEVDELPDLEICAVPLSPGDAVVHDIKLLHAAGPNMTDGPRRAYAMGFSLEPKPKKSPSNYYWKSQLKPIPLRFPLAVSNSNLYVDPDPEGK